MITARLPVPLVAGALLALLLSACGESASHRFRREMRPFQARVDQDRAQIAATLRRVRLHSARAARVLRLQIADLATTGAHIARLNPPGDAARALRRYAAAQRALVAALRRYAGVLARGTSRQLVAAARTSQLAVGSANRAYNDLQTALGSS